MQYVIGQNKADLIQTQIQVVGEIITAVLKQIQVQTQHMKQMEYLTQQEIAGSGHKRRTLLASVLYAEATTTVPVRPVQLPTVSAAPIRPVRTATFPLEPHFTCRSTVSCIVT